MNDRIGRVNYLDIWASDIKYAREKVRKLKVDGCRAKMISVKVYEAAMNKLG